MCAIVRQYDLFTYIWTCYKQNICTTMYATEKYVDFPNAYAYACSQIE